MKTEHIAIAIVLLLMVTVGCGQKYPDGMPTLYPCTVTVVQGEQPLANAIIDLLLKEGETKWNISATTNERGVAELMTHGLYKGAPAGKYKIVVTKRESGSQPRDGYTIVYSVVDLKYTDPSKTPLELEVTPKGGSNKVDVGAPVKVEVDRLETGPKAMG